MSWRKNRKMIAAGYPDLAYVPHERCGWDCTLGALALAVRRDIEGGGRVDLSAGTASSRSFAR